MQLFLQSRCFRLFILKHQLYPTCSEDFRQGWWTSLILKNVYFELSFSCTWKKMTYNISDAIISQYSFSKGCRMRKGAELDFTLSLQYWEIWEYMFTSLWNFIFLNRFKLLCNVHVHSLWKTIIYLPMKKWLTLKGMPFFNRQIKVYWRPEWLKVAMATGVKRASDQTCRMVN